MNAGIGGAGGGTILVAIAQGIGTQTLWGQIILYAAPTLTVVAGVVIFELKFRAERMTERSHVKAARKTLVKQLDDPMITDGYKKELQTKIEDLDRTIVNAEIARVKKRHDFIGR